MVGLEEVLQQIPRSVTSAPPSLVTLPCPLAHVSWMSDTSFVLTVGTTMDNVMKLRSSPYATPAALMA